ncbi:MAG: YerC/YecD family TrpR-related protein [Pseudomonadota bacterium]
MKSHRTLTVRQEKAAENELFKAILSLESPQELRAFFADLCTPSELEAMTDRWSVVLPLHQGTPYREISQQTGVSVTTIGRVARSLMHGDGGYKLAVERAT